MDYSLAALKVVCAQLKRARDVTAQNASTLGGILFQRASLQGILVSDFADGRLLLDDGTGVDELHLSGNFRFPKWDVGYFLLTGDTPMVKGHKMVDLSPFPDRDAMWYLEVIEAYKLLYQPLVGEFV